MIRLAIILALLTAPAAAQSVQDCDWRATAQSIAEPWADNTRTFANGAVRVAILDTLEPAGGAFHILVLSPPYSEIGDRQCRVISRDGAMGWLTLRLADLAAAYDPVHGLTVFFDGRLYVADPEFTNAVRVEVTINQTTGTVRATEHLGHD